MEVKDQSFDIDSAQNTIVIGKSLVIFSGTKPVKVKKFDDILSETRMTRRDMNDMPVDEQHEGFSLCAINGRYALAAGGSNDSKRKTK